MNNINYYKPILWITASKITLEEIKEQVKRIQNPEDVERLSENLMKSDSYPRASLVTVAATIATLLVLTASITTVSISLPALLALVSSGVIGVPAILFILNKDEPQKNIQSALIEAIRESKIEEWGSLIDFVPIKEAYEKSQSGELKFPPNHPTPNFIYKEHPLKSKDNVYIPLTYYDSLILEEEKQELYKILIDLGATEIKETQTFISKNQIESGAEIGIQPLGDVSADFDIKNKINADNVKTATYLGKPWKENWQFDKSKYSWLSFHSDWETIIDGRIKGGLSFTKIYLVEGVSSNFDLHLGVTEGLIKNIAKASINTDMSKNKLKKYTFEVKFRGID